MDFRKKYQVKPGSRVKLSRWDPDETRPFDGKKSAEQELARNIAQLYDLQYLLYAEDKHALLIVLQALDAGGKDGTIRHVMSGVNPQGCHVTAFKQPSTEELQHDFLWRIHKAVPRRGEIGIFNRSHYEDVLVVRVHDLVPEAVWAAHYDQINAFEEHLAANNVHLLKFYLHISKDEQLERLKARLEDPTKGWKVEPGDFEERRHWDDYIAAYEEALTRCSTKHAPWHVIPANHKWYRNAVISQIIVDTLEGLDMKLPTPRYDLSKIRVE